MRRAPRPKLCPRAAWLLCLLLGACATAPHVSRQALDASQQRTLLQELRSFSFNGRVAVTGQDSVPTMEWRQQADLTRLRLGAPWGVGSMQVEFRPGHLRLTTSRGEKLADVEAEQALANAIGFVPAFDALRHWVLGIAAPGSPAETAFDADGNLQQLEQQGWLIRYERRVAVGTSAGELRMPALLIASRDNLKLRLVVDRWRIR
jgi:outer membrane lipoprotein LolB